MPDGRCSGEAAHTGPGRESRRRRRVSSSDDSDFAPLVFPPVASVTAVDALATTQWEFSASVDISSGDECLVRPNVGSDVAARTAQFDEQVRPTLIDGPLQTLWVMSAMVRSEFPIPTRRRGLVVWSTFLELLCRVHHTSSLTWSPI